MVLQNWFLSYTFILVFHRILDFKTGLNFYSDPFFILRPNSFSDKYLYAAVKHYRPAGPKIPSKKRPRWKSGPDTY
jgi:hypothetical protein